MWMTRFLIISGESGDMKGDKYTLQGDRRWVLMIVGEDSYTSLSQAMDHSCAFRLV